MPIEGRALPKTHERKTSAGKWKDECRDCGGSLRIGKKERVEGARRRLCPDCFDRFAAGFFR